jgi:hypothetical protein
VVVEVGETTVSRRPIGSRTAAGTCEPREKEMAMVQKIVLTAVAAALVTFGSPSTASAHGVGHVGYTHVGPGGVYHAGATAVGGYGGYRYGYHYGAVGGYRYGWGPYGAAGYRSGWPYAAGGYYGYPYYAYPYGVGVYGYVP